MNNIDDRNFNTYIEMQKEISRRELSLYEQIDKYLFTLSSAGIGVSIAFIKDIVDLPNSSYIGMLYTSWGFFVLTIAINMVSYIPSLKALKKRRRHAERYYLQNDTSVFDEKNPQETLLTYLRYLSIASYIIAISLTIFFVMLNGDNLTPTNSIN
jgi:hypothetical protein